MRWEVGTADVKTAFLQAPRRENGNQCTIINPPNIAREAGILRFGGKERWLVRKALYGLVESPKDWAVFRDQQLRTLAWTTYDGRKVKLNPYDGSAFVGGGRPRDGGAIGIRGNLCG